MNDEPLSLLFYLVGIPAVLIAGMSKGGLGSSFGSIAVPFMALAIEPVQAAAILLPLLLVMDLLALWKFRGQVDMSAFKTLLPGCLLGIIVGTFIFQQLSEETIRVLIGLISLGFCLSQWFRRHQSSPTSPDLVKGTLWGCIGGITSFGIHAGGPALSVYLFPMKLDSRLLMGTQAWAFGVMNTAKIFAYAYLGQLGFDNLFVSMTLLPFAPMGVLLGYLLLHRLSQQVIYGFCYLSLSFLGVALVLQGASGLIRS